MVQKQGLYLRVISGSKKNPKTKQPNPKSHQVLSTWFSVLLFQLTSRVTFGVSLNHLKHII